MQITLVYTFREFLGPVTLYSKGVRSALWEGPISLKQANPTQS